MVKEVHRWIKEVKGSFIFRGSITSLVLKIFGLVLAYILQWLIIEYTGPIEYGKYAYVINSVMLYGSFAFLGFISSIDRFAPQYIKAHNFSYLKGFTRTAYAVSFLSNLAAGFLFVWAIQTWFPKSDYGLSIILIIILMPLFSFMRLNSKFFVANRQVMNGFLPNQVLRYVFPILLTLAAIWLNRFALGAAEMLIILIISLLLVVGHQFIYIRKLPVSKELRIAKAKYDTPFWMKTSMQLFLVGTFSVVLNRIDIQILAIFEGPFEIGEYNISRRIADLAMFVHASVISVVSPIIASNLDKVDKIKKVIRRSNHLIFWPTLIATLFLYFFSGPIISFFSDEYLKAETTTIILVLGHLSVAFFGPLAVLINMTGNQRYTVWLFAGAALLNVVLNFVLIPRYGIEGAAIATTVVQFLLYLGMFVVVKKLFGFYSSVLRT